MLKIDLHTHTVHSGHAYGTFYDVVREAARKKMKMIAVTDHGPDIIGSAPFLHFGMGPRAPKTFKGVRVLWGCEADPNELGNIGLKEKQRKKLDILLIGLHDVGHFKDKGKKKNTEALIKCFKKYKPHIFTHPGRMMYSYDLEKVCQAAIDNGVLLEVNLSELAYIGIMPKKRAEERLENVKKTVEIAKKNRKKMIVNSDAHFIHEIGDDKILKKYMKTLGLAKSMIINNYPKELEKVLKRKVI